jgi:hypothetical protein
MMNEKIAVSTSRIEEFVLEKQTVNGRLYGEVTDRLRTRVNCVNPEFQEIGSWYSLLGSAQRILRALSASFYHHIFSSTLTN